MEFKITKFFALFFFVGLLSTESYADVVPVKQNILYEKFGCENYSGLTCFESAEFYTKYNLYIFNYRMRVEPINLKGRDIEGYIEDTMGPMLAFLNPIAAKFYGIDPIMRSLVDEKTHPATNITLGIKTDFEGSSYASYIKVNEYVGLDPTLGYKISRGKGDPSELIIQSCEVIKEAVGKLTDEQFNQYCNFGNSLSSLPIKVVTPSISEEKT
ncbi:hypothetical protein [Photobacterium satsumensis]|uniref:hypothetical protein n=1 Tax=Photobacterium satsumensis TaxID=2910239 RepID=UPI003D0AA394